MTTSIHYSIYYLYGFPSASRIKSTKKGEEKGKNPDWVNNAYKPLGFFFSFAPPAPPVHLPYAVIEEIKYFHNNFCRIVGFCRKYCCKTTRSCWMTSFFNDVAQKNDASTKANIKCYHPYPFSVAYPIKHGFTRSSRMRFDFCRSNWRLDTTVGSLVSRP